MRCITPEISWHNRDPVLSIDIQGGGTHESSKGEAFWRVATGGADSHVLIWHLSTNECAGPTVNCVADLDRHQKAVNVVRFSPSTDILASGDDESAIILWKQKEECDFFSLSDDQNKEHWSLWKVLRGHIEDVYDISWSPDSNFLVSGSVDNTAILWNVHKGRSTGMFTDHKGFVQGVSWDPCNQYICTVSTDRQCCLIDVVTKKTVQRVRKSKIPIPHSGHPLEGKTVRLFYDDTFKSFFRRLTFSIDGALIFVPSGIIEPPETTAERMGNATIVFSRQNLKEPVMILPTLDECTIAVRCCPVYYKLQKSGPTKAVVSLPYRIVFAVATQRSVLIYDTQQTSPIAVISNIHYTRLTDVAWSKDGRILIVSSTDGYCTIVSFQNGELGDPYEVEGNNASPTSAAANDGSKENSVNHNEETKVLYVDGNAMDVDGADSDRTAIERNEQIRSRQGADRGKHHVDAQESEFGVAREKCVGNVDTEETESIQLVFADESENSFINKTRRTPSKTERPTVLSNKTPRRVKLITLSSPKGTKKS